SPITAQLGGRRRRPLPARHALCTGNLGELGREIFSHPDLSGSPLILLCDGYAPGEQQCTCRRTALSPFAAARERNTSRRAGSPARSLSKGSTLRSRGEERMARSPGVS